MTDFPSGIKAIIFDFDGTIFDHSLIAFHLIAAYPFDLFRIRNERLVRKSFTGRDYASPEEYFEAFFTTMGKDCSRSPEHLRDWYFNRYMPRMRKVLKKHYKARPGMEELFRRFSAAERTLAKIAVYSDYPLLKERMEALGLSPGPELPLYGPETFGAQKPAARPFLCIAGDLGAAPGEVLVIGDREDTDGVGAEKAGMHFFHLKNRKCWDTLYTLLMDQSPSAE